MHNLLNFGVANLPMVSNGQTRSISAENPDGSKGGGGKAAPAADGPGSRLGPGWKSQPFLKLPTNTEMVLADVAGPGVIQHIWMTTRTDANRNCLLRMYWDNERTPSVEVPLGDFFANGHALRYNVNSMMVCVNPQGAFNSYWPMPFRSHCKMTIENQGSELINIFAYQITYALQPVPEDAAYFHAQWRRTVTSRENPEHILVDNISGKGHYVGTFLAWTQLSNGWWGEGEIKFFMDDDAEFPSICGTGTEDYFGGAWGFEETYSTPFLGYPLWRKEENEVPKHGLYRWHVLDPIRFEQKLKVTIQALGWWPDGKYQPLTDDIASVAYWYQLEPHAAFPKMLPPEQRWPR